MRTNRVIELFSILALTVGAAACDKSAAETPSPTPATDKAAPTKNEADKAAADKAAPTKDEADKAAVEEAAPAPVVDAGPKGVLAPGNNAELIKLVDAVKACDLGKSHPEYACKKQMDPFDKAFDKTKHAATAANLLEDENANVRFLAAHVWKNTMLMQRAEGREYAPRVVAAAAKETEKAVATLLGPILLQGPFGDAAFKKAVVGLAETHPLADMRAGIFSNLAVQGDGMVGFMKARLGAEKDSAVRVAIVSGMYLARGKAAVETCKIYESLLDDADTKVAGKAAYGIVWTNGACKARYEAFLTHFDKRAKDGKVDFSYLILAKYMAQAKQATDAQKARFIAALKTVVSNDTLSGMTRASALGVIGTTPDGKAYAKGFLNDADGSLKSAAKRVVEAK